MICYPPGADWGCAYSQDELLDMRSDPDTLAAMERSEALAWISLSRLTGGQIGTCPVTVRPCRLGCGAPPTWMVAPVLMSGNFAGILPGSFSQWTPHVSENGAWVNSCGCGGPECGCSRLCEALLPGTVGRVEEVWLNGAVLDRTAYRVDNGNRLVRTDGECWPACQDLSQGAHGDDAFSVTYYQGFAPDATILWAVGKLAAQFFLACTGKNCTLPQNVIAVTRQGVQVELEVGLFPGGRTNIAEADALIEAYNPFGLKVAPVIASPDTRRSRMTTVG